MKPLTRSEVAKLSHSELLVELGRRGIKVPPKAVLHGKATCPHCGHQGPIEKDFGIRVMRGQVWAQSWCRTCRGASAPAKEDVKKTVSKVAHKPHRNTGKRVNHKVVSINRKKTSGNKVKF